MNQGRWGRALRLFLPSFYQSGQSVSPLAAFKPHANAGLCWGASILILFYSVYLLAVLTVRNSFKRAVVVRYCLVASLLEVNLLISTTAAIVHELLLTFVPVTKNLFIGSRGGWSALSLTHTRSRSSVAPVDLLELVMTRSISRPFPIQLWEMR